MIESLKDLSPLALLAIAVIYLAQIIMGLIAKRKNGNGSNSLRTIIGDALKDREANEQRRDDDILLLLREMKAQQAEANERIRTRLHDLATPITILIGKIDMLIEAKRAK